MKFINVLEMFELTFQEKYSFNGCHEIKGTVLSQFIHF